jgi:AbiV family abortive infection protein
MSVYIQASKACLDNADRWMQDADLLYANKSYGHAYVTLSYADEELINTYIFWLQTEDVFPEEYVDQFRTLTLSHQLKNTGIFSFVIGMFFAQIITDEEKSAGTPQPVPRRIQRRNRSIFQEG